MKTSEVSEFSILSCTQNQKLGNLENISLPSNSESSYKSRFKNGKNMNWPKSRKVPIWFKRKNKTFRAFRVFNFALHPRSKTRKSYTYGYICIFMLGILNNHNHYLKFFMLFLNWYMHILICWILSNNVNCSKLQIGNPLKCTELFS